MGWQHANTIVPGYTNPQAWNRYSYTLNNPIRYSDPTGHYCVGDDEDCVNDDSGTSKSTSTNTPTPTPTNTPTSTPSPTPTSTPTPTATPTPYSSIQLAVSYLQYSSLGTDSYNYLIAEGYTIVYSSDGMGHVNGTNIEVPANASATYIAGTIAHEAAHVQLDANGTLLEEYQAFLAGDIVRNDVIQAGKGTSADMRHPLSAYTVDINNPNRDHLVNDLLSWFTNNREDIYVNPRPQGYGLPALPVAPWH